MFYLEHYQNSVSVLHGTYNRCHIKASKYINLHQLIIHLIKNDLKLFNVVWFPLEPKLIIIGYTIILKVLIYIYIYKYIYIYIRL